MEKKDKSKEIYASLTNQIEKSEALISEAKKTIAKTGRMLERAGFGAGVGISDVLQSEQCPPELRERAKLDQEALARELEDEQNRLMDEHINDAKSGLGPGRMGGKRRVPRIKV